MLNTSLLSAGPKALPKKFLQLETGQKVFRFLIFFYEK